MSPVRKGSIGSRMLEGSAIALDSIRANKVRAALTILGVSSHRRASRSDPRQPAPVDRPPRSEHFAAPAAGKGAQGGDP